MEIRKIFEKQIEEMKKRADARRRLEKLDEWIKKQKSCK